MAHNRHVKCPICGDSFEWDEDLKLGEVVYCSDCDEEIKIVSCISGRIFDVIVDLRKDSPSFKQWLSVELNSKNNYMIYIPKGIAHGFQTLEDNTEVFYQISTEYVPKHSTGRLWNDPEFNIPWPITPPITSHKDTQWKKE